VIHVKNAKPDPQRRAQLDTPGGIGIGFFSPQVMVHMGSVQRQPKLGCSLAE
jgi:hypothetical protein